MGAIFCTKRMFSPLGTIYISSDGSAISKICFHSEYCDDDNGYCDPLLIEAETQLNAYFNGRLQKFDLPISLHESGFRLRVLEACRNIPYGTTCSYGELAQTIGSGGAARAVGGALHRNPVCIVIPCHRIVGANGALTGFGYGIGMKRALLALEGIDISRFR